MRLKYLRGHLPHIWIFTSRAWNVEAWANRRENRRLSMRNIFQFWCPGERERILPQEREELSSFICVTRLYSCTVFQQILSPQSCVKSWLCLNSIWFTHMPSLYPGPRGFSSQPLIIRCTWGLHLVYIFSQASGCWITSSKRNTLTNTVGWLGFNFLPNCMFMLSWQLNPGGVFSLEKTLPTAKPSA